MKKHKVILLLVVMASSSASAAQIVTREHAVRAGEAWAYEGSDILNILAEDVSAEEVLVTVDYTYTGPAARSAAFVQAIPVDRGGGFDPRTVTVERLPAITGAHQAVLRITKNPNGRDFGSVGIRVCLSGTKGAIVCKDVAFTKQWGGARTEAINIFRFSASRPVIRRGIKSELVWDVYGADQVTLDGVPVLARGEQTVSPTRSQVYTLIARAGAMEVEERASVSVSPFAAPVLAAPFKSVELCRGIDSSGESYRCVSPDGPFWSGVPIHAIVRFRGLAAGSHSVRRTVLDSGRFGDGTWREVASEQSGFSGPGGYGEARFEIYSVGTGVRKLILELDRGVTVEVPYCVECPGHDEW